VTHPKSRASLLWPALFTAVLCGVLVWLGLWQLDRRSAKQALREAISTRAGALPVRLPDPAEWPSLRPSDYEYRHVELEGVFAHDKRVLVFHPSGEAATGMSEPGYLVLTPMRLGSGAYVVVNRGFVPQSKLGAIAPDDRASTATVRITGLMRAPEPRNFFTPADDLAQGRAFTRDPIAIAAHFGSSPAAPFSVDADAATDAADWPKAGTTVLRISDNHLAYALTWFALATAGAAVFCSFAWTRTREPT
jgi:surfeit locus 1 family protein